jgi:hypothetical protein
MVRSMYEFVVDRGRKGALEGTDENVKMVHEGEAGVWFREKEVERSEKVEYRHITNYTNHD